MRAVVEPEGRAAFAAEEKIRDIAAVACLLPRLRLALGVDAISRETDLRGKGAAAARLAVAAVADRDAGRFAGAGDAELAAAARGVADAVGHFEMFLEGAAIVLRLSLLS